MSLLQYRSPISFTTPSPTSRPRSNASSSQAFDSSGFESSDSRASYSHSSPTTPSVGLEIGLGISPSRFPAPSGPCSLQVAPSVCPFSPLSASLDHCSDSRAKGPLHPALVEFQAQSSSPGYQGPLQTAIAGERTARNLATLSPRLESACSNRSSQHLRPLLLASRASTRSSDSIRTPSHPTGPSTPSWPLRQLELPTRGPALFSRSLEDLSTQPVMLSTRGSRHDDGALADGEALEPSASLFGGGRLGVRSTVRPFTAPNTPNKEADPISLMRFPPRHSSSRPGSSARDGDVTVPPGSSLLAARLIGGEARRSESESWKVPGDTDGDFIRKTYAHFAHAGVADDGFADGKEYTREKSGLPAWEDPQASSSYIRSRATTAPSGPNSGADDANRLRASLSNGAEASSSGQLPRSKTAILPRARPDSPKLHLEPTLQPVRSRATSPSRTSAHSDGPLDLGTPGGSRNTSPSLGPGGLPATYSTLSTASGAGHFTSEEWQQQQEIAEQKRAELMSKVDRYGFFFEGNSLPSHNRTILLPAVVFQAPFPRLGKKKDQARPSDPIPADLTSADDGPQGAAATDSKKQQEARRAQQARSSADQRHRTREQGRTGKWTKMLRVTHRDEGYNAIEHDFVRGMDKRLRRRIYKGVPDIWRGAAWWALILRHAGSAEGRASGQKSKSGARDERRLQATGMRRDHAKRFGTLLPTSSPHDVQIDLDVPRTIGGHVQFHTRYGQGQRSLFHVLHAISLLCPDCGYCQGMGPIAAMLLCYLPPDQAYAAMVMLHHTYSLHGTFSPGFPGLVENFYVQNQLVKTYMPEIATKLDEQMVITSAFATKWYITLFANTVPFETQLRIWDAWLLEGQDVITLVAVAIIWSHRAKILSPQADFETILGALSGYFVPEDDDALLHWIDGAMQRKDVRQKMAASRREWCEMVESGQASTQIL